MNIMEKGSTHSDALVCGPSLIDKASQEQGVQASWGYIAENPADSISRENKPRNVVNTKGSTGGDVKNAFCFSLSLAIVFERLSFNNGFGYLFFFSVPRSIV
ncbi:hypothetical protein TRVL_01565 [Trypanosoma vivax]|nr:hypothetical protein TRVL_01565 [Trypanosoma vivax]